MNYSDFFLKEFFADYAPLLPFLFSLNHVPAQHRPLYGSNYNTWDPNALKASCQGLIAVLLSLRKKPIIRYERMSPMAKKLSAQIHVSTHSYFFLFSVCVIIFV